MSGWIKVEKDLANDPRVLRMASRLRHADVTLGSRSRLVVVGALVTLWWYADTHIREDDTLPIGIDQINELVGVDGFCDLMPSEWLQILDTDHVKLVDYTVHNGTTAKKRALAQRRQERRRNGNAPVTRVSRSHHSDRVTREDQEKKEETPLPPEGESRVEGLNLEAWQRFETYRREIRKPLKPASILASQKKLASFGPAQTAVVEQTVANGWQGLFELKHVNGTSAPKGKSEWM